MREDRVTVAESIMLCKARDEKMLVVTNKKDCARALRLVKKHMLEIVPDEKSSTRFIIRRFTITSVGLYYAR